MCQNIKILELLLLLTTVVKHRIFREWMFMFVITFGLTKTLNWVTLRQFYESLKPYGFKYLNWKGAGADILKLNW